MPGLIYRCAVFGKSDGPPPLGERPVVPGVPGQGFG